MYADTRYIKTNRVALNLDDDQHALLVTLAKGKQPAAIARELLMERIAQLTLAQHTEVANAA